MAQLKEDKLITYAYMREECDLPDVIRDEVLESKIYRAQETLRMLMSDEFYQDFLTNYKANTLSDVYLTLQNYINQFIAWQANEYWTTKANLLIHASGFRVHQEENSTPATDIQMAGIIKDAKQWSQYYKQLMVDYLNNHCPEYPLYPCQCNSKDLTGNGFHISVVKNKYKEPKTYGRRRCCE